MATYTHFGYVKFDTREESGFVIGPRGRYIKDIQTKFGVKVCVTKHPYDQFKISAKDAETLSKVVEIIERTITAVKKSKLEDKQKEIDKIAESKHITKLVETEGYCTYHKGYGCKCSRDSDGRVKHGSYPFKKWCKQHDSIRCDCPRLPSGEMVTKSIMYGRYGLDPLKFCARHQCWYCACKRDVDGTVMSSLDGYPIEKYCAVHDSIRCGCIK
uniref:K Homology domain-containing protein n=1 Tax=viral metagenome TaxID=1070528 RepID=A0A6C0J6R2_9ZZZZ